MSLIALLLALFNVSCGKKAETNSSENKGDSDFAVREAITNGLERDKALDDNARNTIALVKNGTYTLNQGLDDLTTQTGNILDIIEEVASPGEPGNKDLAQAREVMSDYLRNRVHQLEACLAAASPAELEVFYDRNRQALDSARNQVRSLLLEYDPELEKYLQ